MSRGLIGARSTLDEVYAVPEVPRTVTWNPIHHREVDQMVKQALNHWDFEIVEEEHSLSQNGFRWFAVYVLHSPDFPEGKFMSVGTRSAMDKSMAIGMCAGQKVTVCSNLMFTGEFVEFRKHSGKLNLEELRQMGLRGVEQVSSQMAGFNKWIEKLQILELPRAGAEALAFRAIEEGVLPPSKIKQFIEVYFQKGGLDIYSPTLGGFHGAMTELQHNNSLIGQGSWNKGLNKLMNQAVIDITEYGTIVN